MIYDPPTHYRLPSWLCDRINSQGLSVTKTTLAAQAAARTSAGDTARAAIFTSYGTTIDAVIAASAPSYHASAVAVSASAFAVSSLTLAATPYYGFSIWLRTTHNDGEAIFFVDPNSSWAYAQFSNGALDFRMATSTGAHGLLLETDVLPIFDGQWHHVLMAMDNVAMSGVCYADDTIVNVTATPQDSPNSAGDINVNGTPFVFGTDTFGGDLIAEFADFSFWGGTNIIVSGAIPQSTRRKFISASHKPVDPQNLPVTPAVLFSGNAAAIQTNLGNGGAVVVTGTAPVDAATSPST